jgi:transposase-like protein
MKSLYHSVGQDHRGMKRVMRRVLGCKSFEAARSILVAIALMHMLKTGQRVTIEGGEGPPLTEPFSVLAA